MQKSTSMDSSRYCDFLRANLPEWKDLSNDAIDFSLFSSITNKVYKVTPKTQGITPETVILRKFCGEEGIVDLEKEAQVFQGMSECGAGPKFFAHEGDLRIEEFIPARIILAHEYKQKAFRRKLARATAAMHKIEIAGLDKETLFEHALKKPSYFGYFDKKCAQDIFTPEEKKIIEKVKHVSSREEQEFIREILPTEDQVLSHNDMLEGNVLVIEGTDDIRFIDYEYASYNFRGYDIGNMFREAIYDYTISEQPYFKVVEENYPSEEELRDYIRYYIVFTDMNEKELEKSDDLINNDESMKSYLEQKYKAEEMKTREDKLYREAKIGSMLSFYYWMVWAVKMFQTNDAQFDYLDFASDNYDHYMKLKAEITADKKK